MRRPALGHAPLDNQDGAHLVLWEAALFWRRAAIVLSRPIKVQGSSASRSARTNVHLSPKSFGSCGQRKTLGYMPRYETTKITL